MSETLPLSCHVSSKGCRNMYTNTDCPCPDGRCWVTEARALQRKGVEPPTSDAWCASVTEPARGAELSECGRYRYRLWRTWDPSLPRAVFVMLNPSTADASKDDPTIRKCIGFAKRWGCGSIEVVNLFPIRATDPRDIDTTSRAAEVTNRQWMHGSLGDPRVLRVVAWGAASRAPRYVRDLLAAQSRWIAANFSGLQCLGPTKGGEPRHPLMLAYSTQHQAWPVAS
jgi:hypothetical protein